MVVSHYMLRAVAATAWNDGLGSDVYNLGRDSTSTIGILVGNAAVLI